MDERNQSAVEAMSRQIARDRNDLDRLLILWIRTKVSFLAQRIAAELEHQQKRKPEVGEIEIYGSGDELRRLSPNDPEAGPMSLRDRTIILVDDVIYTGRTVKSALTIIFRSGRP
jgi:pyrimidine operon attenuation protein/uracil phosphoribosyltransferase